ncbi:Calx-beta domain-containing protein [Candidatus Poriferisodalis sp.]|uniref:Calx-beta domain-containing protein n=1 Tax=Candidatus Poriferisodalis sp. TaxID=3101277 RepID=UPI003AF90D9E
MATADNLDIGPNGSVTVTINSVFGSSTYIGASAVVTVLDDEMPEVTIEAQQSQITEGGDANFLVRRRGSDASPLTVAVSVTGGDSFLAERPTEVTIPAGAASQQLTLSTTSDVNVNEDETVTVTLTAAADAVYSLGSPASASTAIQESSTTHSTVTIVETESRGWVYEGTDVEFTLTRGFTNIGSRLSVAVQVVTFSFESSFAFGALSVKREIQNLEASFAANSFTTTLTVPSVDNKLNEGNRQVRATILPGLYAVPVDSRQASVWVRDDDLPTLTLTPVTEDHVESDDSFPQYTLQRSWSSDDAEEYAEADVAQYDLIARVGRYAIRWFPDCPYVVGPVLYEGSRLNGSSCEFGMEDIEDGTEASLLPVDMPPQGDVFPYSSSTHFLPVQMPSGDSSHTYDMPPRHVLALGGFAYVALQPFKCDVVPGNCGYWPQYEIGTPDDAKVNLHNNAQGVRIESDHQWVLEGEDITFTMSRYGGVPVNSRQALSVGVAVSQDGEFISGSTPQTVSFAAAKEGEDRDLSQTVTISTTDDSIDEADGTVTLTILDPPAALIGENVANYEPVGANGAAVGWYRTITVTVADNDDPAVEVDFEHAAYEVDEGDSVDVTVTLNKDPKRTVVVPLTATGQGGASDTEYSGVPESVEFLSGETIKSFTFTSIDDDDFEDGESVLLGLGASLPAGVSAGTVAQSTVSITDDDAPPAVTVAFAQDSYSVNEGDSVMVTLTLSEDPKRSVYVELQPTLKGGASGLDGNGVPAGVLFVSGETSKTFTFTAHADSVSDDGESVLVNILEGTLPDRVTEGTIARTEITIVDVPAVTVKFGAASVAVDEGDSVTVEVTLSADPKRTVWVPITTAYQGGASRDDHEGVPGSLQFSSGQTSKSFTFTATDDDVDDDGESVKLGFGSLSTGVTKGTPAESTISITDDDDPAVTVSFGAASYSADEGGTATVEVRLNVEPEREVVIPLTAAGQGGASSPEDYSAVPASVTFASGEKSKSFTFTAAADDVDDDDESVLLGFGASLPAGVTKGTPDESTVSIGDDDYPAVTVNFAASAYEVNEGDSVTVVMTLTASPERTVWVPVTIAYQDGASSADHTSVIPVAMPFASGTTSRSFTFTATADSVDDDDESVKLTFGATLPAGVTKGSVDAATVSIVDDDDPAVSVSFGAVSYSVAESDDVSTAAVSEHEAVVTVTLSAAPERTVVVPITATGQGGASAGDYSGVPASVTFAAEDTSASFTFAATADSVDDDDESVKLTFGATLPAGVTKGSVDAATVSIVDDDDPAVSVSFGAVSYSVAESDDVSTAAVSEHEAEVTVTLSAAPERTVTVPITATGQGGASGDDYSGVPASVTFAAEDTSVSFTFAATADSVDDDDESVKLTFGATLPAGVTKGSVDAATVSIVDDDVPAVSVSFGAVSYSVAESDDVSTAAVSEHEAEVTVTLSAAPERTVTVPITATGQGGASGDDYSGVPASVTFAAQDTSVSFTFAATADTVDDDDESVLLGLGALPDGVAEGTVDESVISIVDDDDPAVSVSFGAVSYSVAESDDVSTAAVSEHEAEVTVTLSAAPERTVTVPITATGQGGASGDDYSGVPASVTFAAQDTSVSFTFAATADDLDDDDESVLLGLGALPDGVAAGSPDESVVSIVDDDVPAVSVSFGAVSYSVAESDDVSTAAVSEHEAVVTVTLSAAPERTVVVPITVSGQGGASGDDYSGVPASVSFGAEDTSVSFTFAATADTVDDDDESVLLGLGALPEGVAAGSPDESVVSIVDDDVPAVSVSFGAVSYSVAESDDVSTAAVSEHEAVVTVTLSAAPERTVVVPITVSNQGGASGDDYSGVPASVTFAAQDTSVSFTFAATADDLDDDDESVLLGLGALPAGVSAGSPDAATVSIVDDDDPAVTVSFGAVSYSVAESDDVSTAAVSEHEAVVTVTLSAAPERTVVVPITVSGQGGASGDDYSGVPASVSFGAEDTSVSFTFAATADTVDDDDESVLLGLGALPEGVAAGSPDESVVSIVDDDVPAVSVSFGAVSYSVAESDDVSTAAVSEHEAVVTVTLSAAPERTVTVPITATGQGGASGDDYSGVPASVTFAAEDTSVSFTFAATADTVDDDDESVLLGFGALPAVVTKGSVDAATISIVDDDDPAVSVSFGAGSYSVAESDDVSTAAVSEHEAVVTVTLSAAPERTVVVPITVSNQGGASGDDYSGVPASVTFAAQDTSASFTFAATADSVDDDDESVELGFGASLPEGVTAGSVGTATVSIVDDDVPAVSVSFGAVSYSVAESDDVSTAAVSEHEAVVTVTLSAAPERTVVVPITATGQGGASGDDYSGVPASVSFGAEDTSVSFTFAATADDLDDDDESVLLGLGALPAGVSAGSPDAATVSIVDDDDPALSVSFGASSYSVAESDDVSTAAVSEHEATVTVTLSAAPERTVVVPITATGQGGATGDDYSGVPASVTFAAEDTSASFTFAATADSVDDDDESVLLTFGATLPAGVTKGSVDAATVSIVDDDDPAVSVSFGAGSYSVAESDDVSTAAVSEHEATVTVTLSAVPERTVVVPITATGQGGATGDDYSGVPASVTFAAEDTSASFTFAAAADSVDDDDESVKLTFGATLPAGVTKGSVDAATVSIVDDDDPAVSVSFGAGSYSVAESDDVSTAAVSEHEAVVTVTLSAAPERTVVVPITATGQGGATAGDYSGVPASVSFGAEDTSVSFTFAATADTVDDDDESVKLGFGALPDGVAEGTVDESVVSIVDDDVPAVSVSFGAVSYSVAESDDVSTAAVSEHEAVVTVTLSAAPERTVVVPITATGQGGASGDDYSGVPASVTFGAEDTSVSFTFAAAADSVDDDDESVKLGLGALPAGVAAGSPDASVVSIVDDDVPAVSVSFGAVSYSVAESDDVSTAAVSEHEAVVTVTLSAAPERTVVVPITATGQGGATGDDYSGVPASVTFAAEDTSVSFTFTATADDLDDDDESVKLTFGALPDGVAEVSPDTSTVSIVDDDVPAVSVSFGAVSYSVAESDDVSTAAVSEHEAEVTVTLSAAPERAVVVPITATGQGGATGDDYSGVPASVTFAAEDTSVSFTFAATADGLDDDDESVELTFGATLPEGVTRGTPDTSTVSIVDDDVPAVSVSFGAGSYSVAESDDVSTAAVSEHEATVTVTLSAAPERTVVVPITATGQGGATGDDYSGVPASVTFAAEDTSVSFTFTATADDLDDDDESVKLTFGALPDGVAEVSPDTSTVSIVDDDVPALSVSFGAVSYSVAESDDVSTAAVSEHEAEVTVTLSAAPERAVVVPITATGQGGASAGDYSGVPASVTFGAGETVKSFTFAATADTVDDDDESVKLTFGATLPEGMTKGTPDTSTISIVDDDVPAVSVSFGAGSYSVAESDDVSTAAVSEHEAAVTVTLSAAPERAVVVPITATGQGGASAGDYSGVPASVSFGAGETVKSFTFTATADTVDDDDESVLLGLGALPAGVSAGSLDASVVSIVDDDDPAVSVSFGAGSYSVAESDDVSTAAVSEHEAEVTVTLSAAPERAVVVPITATGRGGATGDDYSGVPASVSFGAGETVKSFTFAATADTMDDDDESVELGFGATLPAGVTAGSVDESVVSIVDDDVPAVTVSFGAASYSVAESDDVSTAAVSEHEATVTVTLSAAPERTVVVPITATGQGGASGDDYSGVPASVSFGAGETVKSFTFAATADGLDDDDESVLLGLGALPAGVAAGSPDAAAVSIVDDDDPAVTVSFGAASYSADEGDTAVVTVRLSAAPERAVVVPITVTGQGGVSAGDYSGVPASVSFGAAETVKSFTFTATADDVDDDDESVKLTFGATLPAGVTRGTVDTSTISIVDDDDPAVSVSFGAVSYSVAESDDVSTAAVSEHEAEVTVTLSAAPERTVVVPITATGQGGASGDDYSGVPASVTFAAQDTSVSFTFAATADDLDDDDESVLLGLGALPAGVAAGSPDAATVSIVDDDDPAVTVRFGAAGYSADEGDTAVVTVRLSAAPERAVVVPITATGQGGVSAGDYSGVPASVSFGAAETSKSFTFTATADDVDDDGESVKLGFGSLPAGVTEGSPDESVVSISDDDVPTVSVSFGASSYSVAESDDVSTAAVSEHEAEVTVTLSAAPERAVTVPITVSGQGGASGDDYSGVPASVSFGAEDTSVSFTFAATADTVDDDDESVLLGLGALPEGVSAGSVDASTISIVDDDVPALSVSFGAGSYSVAESDDVSTAAVSEHEAEVTVTLSAAPERTVVVPITATGQGGASGDDYSGVPASVTFAAEDTSVSFTFTAAADSVDDDDESVLLGLGALPEGVSAGSVDASTISIVDDDVPAVSVSFGAGSYSVAESDDVSTAAVSEHEAEVTVTLSAAPERTVVVPITATGQGGASGDDYSGVPASVTFAAEDTSVSFTFAAAADSVDDDDESVKLTFGATLPAGVTRGTPDTATISIVDDDDPAVSVSFGAVSYSVAESDDVSTAAVSEHEAVVTVTLSAAPERTVVVPITVSNQGGASAGDYSGVPASVSFGAGETVKSFTFTAAADTVDDDDESVLLGFGALPDGVAEGTVDESVISIVDDDDPAVTVSFGAGSYSVAESDDVSTAAVSEHEATVTVTLSAAPERTVVVPITATGQGGASGDDYSGVPASVSFGAGETVKSFTFTATADDLDDDDESVLLGLGALPAGVSAGSPDAAAVSIVDDDDPAVTVSFGAASYSADEGDTAVVTVRLSAAPERVVVVPITATGQGGATAGDYSGVPASVTFAAEDTSVSFTFTATADSVDDDDESVLLGFGALPAGVSAGTVDESTVSISDDDVPTVSVSFGAGSYSAAEGDSVTVVVELHKDPERTVVVPITTTDQGGASGDDYSGVPASVSFGAAETVKSFTFTATADSVDDDDESVKLGFGATLPAGVTRGTVDTSTISIVDDDDPAVSVSFGAVSYSVAESDDVSTAAVSEHEAEVTVTLSAAPERTVVVPITATGQGGASGDDYSGVPASVSFAAEDTSVSFTFAATADDVDDDDESVLLGFGALPDGVAEGSVDTATVSIVDDDVPAVSVSFGAVSYSVAESDDVSTAAVSEHEAVVTVTLSAAPERTVVVPITVSGQGGASGDDYSGVPASVSFGAEDTSVSFTFAAAADSVDDDDESVLLGFGALPEGVAAGSPDESVVSIVDDDVPAVSVSFGAGSYSVAESDDVSTAAVSEHEATVTVTLSAAPERTVVVPITVSGQGGASGDDYSGVPASVTFAAEDTSVSFTFTATADGLDDDDESVELTFGATLPAGVTKGSVDAATVSIVDDDDPAVTVSFGAASYSADEGDTAVVTVRLSVAPERAVVVPITVTGQGGVSAGDDYSGVPASVSFGAEDTSVSFTFAATADSVDDDDESVLLGFGSLPAGVSAGTVDESTVSITDDDDPAVTVRFGAAGYSADEGGTAVVTVRLSVAPERTVVVPITATGQGGASGDDYSGVPASVSFGAEDTSVSFTFAAAADTVDDDDESVKLTFGATLPAGVTRGTVDTATISIVDDDVPAVSVSFGAASYSVAESDDVSTAAVSEHEAEVTVTLSAAPERAVTVPITATGQGGASGDDYSGVPASVTFAAEDTSVSFTFTATADDVDDDDESVLLGFGALPAGVTRGTVDTATISIVDDDVPAVSVSFGAGSYSVAESDDVSTAAVSEHEATVTVTLSAAPERTVTVPITATGQGGASGDDYSGVPASVTFGAGETVKSFTFAATADGLDDDDESVLLGFGALPAGVAEGSPDAATVTINDDDDPAVTVRFGAAGYSADEGDTAVVTVRLSAVPERAVVVPITVTGQGGVSAGDYSGVPASVSFGAAETSVSFTFTATADSVDDDGESVKLGFGSLPAGVTEGSPDESVVSISDDDVPTVSVSFGAGSYSAAEGDSVTVVVELHKDPERTVVVPITVTGQGGASGDDYSGVPASVSFGAGETVKSFTFTATADDVDDDGESVKLGFGSPLPAGVSTGTVDESVISIVDDDDPALTASFGAAGYSADEGGTAVVTVSLSVAPERTVVIPLTATDQGGASADDYSGVPASVTFAAAETSKSFTFAATADSVDDDGESVKLGFGAPLPAGVSTGTVDESVISIVDDDDPALTASFGAASYSVDEGDTVEVKVRLSVAPGRTVVLLLLKALGGGASADDYSGVPDIVSFAPGETVKSFTFAATADSLDDDDESVLLGFGALPTGVSTGTVDESVISIVDDDEASRPTTSFSSDPPNRNQPDDSKQPKDPVLDLPEWFGRESDKGTVMVVNGWRSPDIAVASVLGGIASGAVMLYTDGTEMSDVTQPVLSEYELDGACVVGGLAVISDTVHSTLRHKLGPDRVAWAYGLTRLETAAAVARQQLGEPDHANPPTIIVADGWRPPDTALAAVMAAQADNTAVLYSKDSKFSPAAIAVLRDYQPEQVILIGGTSAISNELHADVTAAAARARIERISGATRIETASLVARQRLGSPDSANPPTIIVANAWSPSDVGLAVVLAASMPHAVVLYVDADTMSPATASVVAEYGPERVTILGGEAAVGPAVEAAIRGALPAGAIVSRISGSTRAETAAAVAHDIFERFGNRM